MTIVKDLDGCPATVNPDTRFTADSGSTVNDRFNELVHETSENHKFSYWPAWLRDEYGYAS